MDRDPLYENFYIWHDGITNSSGGRPLPPNNWVCNFRFSAWEWNEKRGQYYYHAFAVQQVIKYERNRYYFLLQKFVF